MKILWKPILKSLAGGIVLTLAGFGLDQLSPKPVVEGVFFTQDGSRVAALHYYRGSPSYHTLKFGYVADYRKVDGDFMTRALNVGGSTPTVFEDKTYASKDVCRISVVAPDGHTLQITPLEGCTGPQAAGVYGTFIRRVTGTVETCSPMAADYVFANYVEQMCAEFPFLSMKVNQEWAVEGCPQIREDSWQADRQLTQVERQQTKQLEAAYGAKPTEASCAILKGIYQQKYDALK